MADSNDLSVKLNKEKDFTSEYRKSVEIEIPDLWDRINAGIDAREKEKQTEPVADIVEFEAVKKSEKKTADSTAKKAAKKSRRNPSVYIMPAVAAVICIGIMIPLFMRGGMKNPSDCSESTAPAGAAMPQAADDSMPMAANDDAGGSAMKTEEAADAVESLDFAGLDGDDSNSVDTTNYGEKGGATLGHRNAVAGAEHFSYSQDGLPDTVDGIDSSTVFWEKPIYSNEETESEDMAIASLSLVKITVKEGTSEDDIIKLAEDCPETVSICYETNDGYILVLDRMLEEDELKKLCEDLKKENNFIISAEYEDKEE
ncbi:hypothetical protein SAMN02910370_02546 [Lachnospiraceae bacterium XPB1003]|nr:hypothetical protein SAMN02910370_02546 [Lachnospiraceae bacterium XPB1003]